VAREIEHKLYILLRLLSDELFAIEFKFDKIGFDDILIIKVLFLSFKMIPKSTKFDKALYRKFDFESKSLVIVGKKCLEHEKYYSVKAVSGYLKRLTQNDFEKIFNE